jgi:hypothetical protein
MLAPHLNLKNNNFNDEDDDMFADTLMKAIIYVFRGGNMASQVVNAFSSVMIKVKAKSGVIL